MVRERMPALRQEVSACLSCPEPGVRYLLLGLSQPLERMLRDVLEGLDATPQRRLPCTYFYDDEGSRLYEAITGLTEYYPTRHEAALLRGLAPELASRLSVQEIVELGSGSSAKTRFVLEAFGAGVRPLSYVPIDVSPSSVRGSAEQLVRDYPLITVLGLIGRYEEALATLSPALGRLFLFLGGTLGNFTPAETEAFLAHLQQAMAPGDHLLLGFDRAPHASKPPDVVVRAYDDAQGVTARFNLNLLARLNRDLGTDFRLSQWRHRTRYDEGAGQIEMHLDSLTDQVVFVPPTGSRIRFRAGESLLTEISRKFDPASLADTFEARGFRCAATWTDPYVGLMLLRAPSDSLA